MTEKCSICRRQIKTGEMCLLITRGSMGMLSEGDKYYYHDTCVEVNPK